MWDNDRFFQLSQDKDGTVTIKMTPVAAAIVLAGYRDHCLAKQREHLRNQDHEKSFFWEECAMEALETLEKIKVS